MGGERVPLVLSSYRSIWPMADQKDGIRNKPYLGREIAEYLFEAITDNTLLNLGAMALYCRVLLSAVLTYCFQWFPRLVALGGCTYDKKMHQSDRTGITFQLTRRQILQYFSYHKPFTQFTFARIFIFGKDFSESFQAQHQLQHQPS